MMAGLDWGSLRSSKPTWRWFNVVDGKIVDANGNPLMDANGFIDPKMASRVASILSDDEQERRDNRARMEVALEGGWLGYSGNVEPKTEIDERRLVRPDEVK